MTVAPTCESIFNDELGEAVNRTDDATWRHGSYRSEVYRRESDDTFWLVYYRVSTDGETNELREGFAKISQVWPKAVSVIRYLSADKWSAA